MLNIRYLFALIGLVAALAFLAVFASNADQKPVEESSCVYQNLRDGQWLPIENPKLSDPDWNHLHHALKNLDLLVVQELFLSETAQVADIVLPAASVAEKDGTFTNTERRCLRIRKAIEPVGNALPDWQIIARLSEAMGYPMPYEST